MVPDSSIIVKSENCARCRSRLTDSQNRGNIVNVGLKISHMEVQIYHTLSKWRLGFTPRNVFLVCLHMLSNILSMCAGAK